MGLWRHRRRHMYLVAGDAGDTGAGDGSYGHGGGCMERVRNGAPRARATGDGGTSVGCGGSVVSGG
jgi:hypothetical protein